jgi:arylsulfatase A-like enzyme
VEKYAQTGWTDAEKAYAAMVDRLDSDVGRVTALLKELKLDNNTLIMFASDNGPGCGRANTARFGSQAGLRETKGSLWEGGIRVPLIARWPGKVAAGRTTDFATAFWDFLPTAADLGGARAPRGIDGISIAPTLLGRQQKPHDYLYWERTSGPNRMTRAVRLGDWKGYQETAQSPVELYDLKSDPAESKNVAAEHPEVVARVGMILDQARVDVKVPELDKRIWEKYKQDNARQDALLAQ